MKDLRTILRKYDIKEEDLDNIIKDLTGAIDVMREEDNDITLFNSVASSILDDISNHVISKRKVILKNNLVEHSPYAQRLVEEHIVFQEYLKKQTIDNNSIAHIFIYLTNILETKEEIYFRGEWKSEILKILTEKRKIYKDSFDKEISQLGLIAASVRIADKHNAVIKYLSGDVERDEKAEKEAIFDYLGYLVLLRYILHTQYEMKSSHAFRYKYDIPFDNYFNYCSIAEKIDTAIRSIRFNDSMDEGKNYERDFEHFKDSYNRLYNILCDIHLSKTYTLEYIQEAYYDFCSNTIVMIEYLTKSYFMDIHLAHIKDLLIRRNSSYNNSFHRQYQLYGITAGVVRLNDKYNRIMNISDQYDENNDKMVDSLIDSFYDLLGYSILLFMELFLNA